MLARSDEAALVPPAWVLLAFAERDPPALLAPPSVDASDDAEVSSPLDRVPPLADAVPLESFCADPPPPLEHPATTAVIATLQTKEQAPAFVREPTLRPPLARTAEDRNCMASG